jgi:hypothetical protein
MGEDPSSRRIEKSQRALKADRVIGRWEEKIPNLQTKPFGIAKLQNQTYLFRYLDIQKLRSVWELVIGS